MKLAQLVSVLALLLLLMGLSARLILPRLRIARQRMRESREQIYRDGMICSRCGYNMRATPLRCSECGYEPPQQS